ncbi:hypothetical protein LTR70_005184 [Exophiala xenobiotica]|uniref:Uncharacterized protein n=1 Tax=Lithohypha guttulata TaxID=1690604 RepID=A0ABR0KC63_9EURO|nr:hypothetical protein LTR24_004747 [Lithohypha guttulata]KAK5318888.1 hypothetical protein LTR70_005184 [Exophiala xenobiotica]
MNPPSSPSPFGDFVVVESDDFRDLSIRTRLRQEEIQQYRDDQSSDSDLEHISRPSSVRSLSTRSPSPFTEEYREHDGDVSMTYSIENIPSPYFETASRRDTSSQLIQGAIGYSQSAPPATQTSLMAPSTGCQAGSAFTHQRSPDDALTGVNVLTPPPALLARQTRADLGSGEHVIPDKAVDVLRLDANTQRCDHATVDQHIMDLLTENALDTRLEHEYGSSAPRDQNLRQQMMARLRSLPVDHSVMKEATKHASWGSFLLKHQARDNAERKHIYLDVFTPVELAALQLLLQCHEKHFDAACSFADVASTVGLQFFDTIDLSTITKASKLALQTQGCCLMGTGFGEVRLFMEQNQLRPHTRTVIKRQAESLERDIETQAAQPKYLGTPTGKWSNACPAKDGNVGTLKYAHYERIATRDVFNDTLKNLPGFLQHLTNVEQQEVEQKSQCDARRPLCSKRQAPQDGAEKAFSYLGMPTKRLSMPRALSANAEIIQSTPPTVSSPYVVPNSDDPEALTIESRYQRGASVVAASVPDDELTNPANQQGLQRQLMPLQGQDRERLVLRSQMPERLHGQAPSEQNLAYPDTLILQPTAPTSFIDVIEGVQPVNAVSAPTRKMHYMTLQQQQMAHQEQQQYQDLWQQPMLANQVSQQQQIVTQAPLRALQRFQQHEGLWMQTSKPEPLTKQAPQSQFNPPPQARLHSSTPISPQLQEYQMQLMLLESTKKDGLKCFKRRSHRASRLDISYRTISGNSRYYGTRTGSRAGSARILDFYPKSTTRRSSTTHGIRATEQEASDCPR